MKRSMILTAIVATAVFSLIAIAPAQNMKMMGGDMKDKGHGMGKDSKMTCMMGNMSKECQMMSDSFGDLQKHFDSMMNMDNMSDLKTEMQKHQQMMSSISDKMSEHRGMCKDMMSKMGSGGMEGNMMDMKSKSGEQGHDH